MMDENQEQSDSSCNMFPEIKQVACGQNHSLILLDNGRVFSMGSNKHNQLGLLEQRDYFVPIEIVGIEEPIEYLSAGFTHSLLLSKSKTVWAMGNNVDKQLAFKDDNPKQLSLQKITQFDAVDQVIATDFTSAIIDAQNAVHHFGIQDLKPHTLLNNKLILLPDWVTIPENFNIVDISVGKRHALFLTVEGQVYGLGSNQGGLLGLGEIAGCENWALLYPQSVTQIKATSLGSLVLTVNHHLMATGINSWGQFSSPKDSKKIIDQFKLIASEVTTFGAYDSHTLYVQNNQLFALGCNDEGQLGLGESNRQETASAAKPFILGKSVVETTGQKSVVPFQIKKPEFAFFENVQKSMSQTSSALKNTESIEEKAQRDKCSPFFIQSKNKTTQSKEEKEDDLDWENTL